MEALLTPESCFDGIKDFPYQPNYVDFDGLKMHYIDEGNQENDEIILAIHGEPTWSYLYRKFVPVLAHDHFSAVFRGWRHLFRICHGANLDGNHT